MKLTRAKALADKRKRVVAYLPEEQYDNIIKLSKQEKLSVSQIINKKINQ